ncbi:hypothetical protein UlMin_032044 [Ulmus minor]
MECKIEANDAIDLLNIERIFVTGSEKIAALVKATNVEVESYWPSLFAKVAEKCKIGDLISNAGASGGGALVAAAAGGGAAAAAPVAEGKKFYDFGIGFSLRQN